MSHKLGKTEARGNPVSAKRFQFRQIGHGTLSADALVNLAVMFRDSGAESKAKPYLLEALRTAIETKSHHTALQRLVEIVLIEMKEQNLELPLELAMHCLQHPSTN